MANIKDQENTTGGTGIGFGDSGGGRRYLGMGFIPSSSVENITHFSFYIKGKDGDTDIGLKVWIDTADASYFPDNGVEGIGGVTQITNATIDATQLTKYTLDSSVSLTAGNKYVFIMVPWDTNLDSIATSFNDVDSSTANPYANGRRIHLDDSYANPVAPDSGNADILFETWGDEPVVSGTAIFGDEGMVA